MHRSSKIAFSASGDNTIVAAPVAGPITVYGLLFTTNGATNIIFRDTAANDYSGSLVFTGNGSSMTLPMVGSPWFQVQAGNGFVMNSTSAVGIAGIIWYDFG